MIYRLLFLLLFLPMISFSQEIWDLDKCINYGIENNLALQKDNLSIEFAQKQQNQTKLNYLPTVSSNATHEYNWGQRIDPFTNQFATERVRSNNFYLSSRLVLFSGMQNYYLNKQATSNKSVQDFNYLINKRNLKIDIISGYLKILLNQEILKTDLEQKEITVNQLKRVNELIEAGRETKALLIELKAKLASDELKILQSKNEIKLSFLDFRVMLNLSDSIFFVLDTNDLFAHNFIVDSLKKTDFNPLEIEKAKKEEELTKTKIELEKSKNYPSLTLNGSVGSGYSGNNRDFNDQGVLTPKNFGVQIDENLYQNISLNLTIPIFNNGKNNLAIQQAQINYKEALLNKQITQIEYWNKINRLFLDINNTKNELENAKVSLEFATTEFLNSQLLVENGRISNFEFQEIVNKLFISKSNLLQLKYQILFKKMLYRFYTE